MPQKPLKFNKFSVSESLEKVAIEKGLAKPEPKNTFKKVAEASKSITNLAPTENLFENILKLCEGLRSQGFNKYADEVEAKFLQYKKAETLYDVSGETGDDLVDRAHPDGSHKMEDVAGDSVIETILEQHKKIKEVVNKTPTGKLAAKDAINFARIILAQSGDEVELNLHSATSIWNKINQIIKEEGGLSYVPGVGRGMEYWADSKVMDSKLSERPMKLDMVDDIKGLVDHIKNLVSPGITGGVSKQAWMLLDNGNEFNVLQEFLDKARQGIEAKLRVERSQKFEDKPKTQEAQDPYIAKFNELMTKLNASSKINDKGKKVAIDYLNARRLELNNPETHDKGAKGIDDMEKHLTDKNLI